MVQITLPDGSKRDYPAPVTVADVAASIGAGLAKAALAGNQVCVLDVMTDERAHPPVTTFQGKAALDY